MEYRTVWIKVTDMAGPRLSYPDVIECQSVDRVVAWYAQQGWTIHAMAPGTGGPMTAGLFVTFARSGPAA